jgi:predicted ester cyclase
MVGGGDFDVADEFFSPTWPSARQWVAPFCAPFSDVHMEVVALVAEGDQIAGRFRCSGTHTGTWLGHPPTGRRFDVDEVCFSRVAGDRIVEVWGLEGTAERLRQLGLT